jgi:hypothetical protein
MSQSASPITDCLEETGLNRFNCTMGNACFSCRTVPICSAVITSLGGPGSEDAYPFVTGINTFSGQYAQLNASYSTYFSTLAAISPSDISASVQSLSSVLSTISVLSSAMPQNPIFPIPSNTNLESLYATCGTYNNYNQPWYCVDVGLCKYLNFNSSLLSSDSAIVARLQASPLSSSGLSSVSANSSSIAKGYVMAIISSKENATFHAFLNATEPQYNSTVQKSQALLAMFSNTALSASLGTLLSTFANVLNSGSGQNMTVANAMVSSALSKTNTAYSVAYSAFLPVYNTEQSNNHMLVVDQLDYVQIPAGLAKLALEQQEINAKVYSGVNSSQLPAVLSELKSVNSGLGLIMTFTLGSLAKAIDGGLLNMALGGSATLASKDSAAVLYAAAISFVIGAAVVLLFYVSVYHRLMSKHRIKLHRRARNAWHALFAILGIAVLVYVFATYSVASGANAFLPVSGFLNAVKSSSSVALVLNGTSPGALTCAGSVAASIGGTGKKVYVVSLASNGTCSSASAGFSGDCMGRVAGMMPIVLMNSAGNSSIAYRGMYGHVLYANGNAASGTACSVDELFSS